MSVTTLTARAANKITTLVVPGAGSTQLATRRAQVTTVNIARASNAVGGFTDFTQTFASPLASWTVNHNLGRKPVVTVMSPGGMELIAEVLHVSTNQLIVSFAAPQAGSIRCV